MIKTILIILVTLSLSINLMAQTSDEEYRYMHTGYGAGVDQGLSIKPGYSIRSGKSLEFNGLTIQTKYLQRSNKTLAGMIVEFVRPIGASGKVGTMYCAVPHRNSDNKLLNDARQNFYANFGFQNLDAMQNYLLSFLFEELAGSVAKEEALIKTGK